ncbi:AfsR/SARP family transcriptional regulator [Amycolatopsis sp. YIM 10]|uniref:AfsR/SARP family transcriptional regulator n=1 Tax=Amycolatopsis sp. YIM 10 TaxID=2653857 RepID=UPI0012A85605|nr:AfsR/SARP family transcriptional regulator [Amycolatopsis sp. YIM 10]QFU92560.1 Regulatory protein AfsR [Amycolatopsis sp. YIM 10]
MVEPAQLDLHRYRAAVVAGAHENAFELWRGEPFAGLHTDWLDDVRRALVDEHFAARLDHHDAQLDLGSYAAVLPGIAELGQEHPFNERLHGQYLLALARGGRQAEALDHYETVRRRLADALGADPGPELRGIHHDILAGTVTGALRQTAPRQLPPDIRGFVGREASLASLSALLDDLDVTGAGPIVISAIDGAGGIGKHKPLNSTRHSVGSWLGVAQVKRVGCPSAVVDRERAHANLFRQVTEALV